MAPSQLAPKTARSAKTQDRILDATEALLNADPYGQLSMPGIAKAAQVSVGGLYGRFASRDALLSAVHDRYRIKRDQHLSSRLDSSTIPARLSVRIEAVVRAFIDLHSQNAGVLRSFLITKWLTEAAPVPPEISREIQIHRDRVVGFLAEALPSSEQKTRRAAIERAASYIISISKDQIVVSPDNPTERAALDTQQLANDLQEIARVIIEHGA